MLLILCGTATLALRVESVVGQVVGEDTGMKLILTITISSLMLAGCADTYSRSAMPMAAAGLQHETVGCKARWTAKEFKTYSDWQACQLIAERGFARAINLTKMDAFEVYAADMQALAEDRDAKRVTERQVRSRAEEILWKFLVDCGCKPGWMPNPNYNHWLMAAFTTPQPPAMIPMTP